MAVALHGTVMTRLLRLSLREVAEHHVVRPEDAAATLYLSLLNFDMLLTMHGWLHVVVMARRV